jgi:tetratricopeptide (TPR) repeat protein
MVNAYLAGDLEELERRQYYYTGKRDYSDFLQMLQVAIQVAPPNHRILPLLKVQQAYLSGLIERLQMPVSSNLQALRNRAISFQRKAMELEPYAAYIHNEMGNLLLQEKRFDSADYHFNTAIELAPTWAIPWSNLMRRHLLAGNTAKAMDAARVADSLQPGVSFVQMNKGLVMEKEKNLLAAETFYLQAIEKNDVHFLPYERLGHIYLEAGKYEKADDYFFDASLRKNDFSVNSDYFHIGVELGGPPRANPRDPFSDYCNFSSIKEKILQPYILLVQGLWLMHIDTAGEKDGVALLEQAIKLSPNMMFASHYLGKYYYKTGNWQKAEKYILNALEFFGKDTLLFANSPATSYVFIENAVDSCLIPMLAQYRYDKLEDYYLLAGVYEKKKMNEEALKMYRQIAKVENDRLTDQANLSGYEEFVELNMDEGYGFPYDIVLEKNE